MKSDKNKAYVSALISFTKGITKLNKVIGNLLAYTMIALTGLIIMEVFLRYVLQTPTIWVFDVSLWLFGMPAILGGGYVLTEKGHVNMDLIYARFSPRSKAVMDVITSIFFFAFVGVLAWQGTRFAISAYLNNEVSITTWQIIIWPLKTSIPLAAVLLILQGLAKFIQDIYLAITGRELI